jgi:transketolase
MNLNIEILTRACAEARGLAIDAVHQAASGHLGLPLGATEIGAVLYGHALVHNPDEPRWINRSVRGSRQHVSLHLASLERL